MSPMMSWAAGHSGRLISLVHEIGAIPSNQQLHLGNSPVTTMLCKTYCTQSTPATSRSSALHTSLRPAQHQVSRKHTLRKVTPATTSPLFILCAGKRGPVTTAAAAVDQPQDMQAEKATESQGDLDPNTTIIFVLGGPGSGKGTQCAKIAEKYDCLHLSTGDLLRDEVDNGSELGKKCDKLMKEGQLVPEEVMVGLTRDAMLKSGAKRFLIDGFPRELGHAHSFEEQIMPCKLVLSFDCPFDVLESRLKERAKTSDRADDNPETMRKRFDTFQEQSKPVIEHFTKQGRCRHISAEDGPDEIFEKVCAVLDKEL